MDPLSQLRDIHLPEPISQWWPLAPGWWVLIAIALALLFAGFYLWRRRQQRLRPQRLALMQLDATHQAFIESQDSAVYLQEVNQLLKRIALEQLDQDASRLSGNKWLEFLDQPMDSSDFSQGSGRCLKDGPYAEQTTVDGPALHQLCQRWVKAVA